MLTDLIPRTNIYDRKLIEMWVNVKDTLLKNHIVGDKEIPPSTANKYKGDMFGLLMELGISESAVWPHIFVNGYKSSSDYDGKVLTLKVIDPAVVERYYNSYLRN